MATKDKAKDLALTKDMVEVRIGQLQSTQYGYYGTLLLYQNPNATFEALDKMFGTMGWTREHVAVGNDIYCKITVKDEKGNAIYRMDVGSAGDFEPEKSRATDGFKRAAMNFVPAFRALRKSPKIRIKLNDSEVYEGKNGKLKCTTNFIVSSLAFDETKGCFTDLVIVDENGNKRWDLKDKAINSKPIPEKEAKTVKTTKPKATATSTPTNGNVCAECGKDITSKVYSFSMDRYKKPLCMDCQKKALAA